MMERGSYEAVKEEKDKKKEETKCLLFTNPAWSEHICLLLVFCSMLLQKPPFLGTPPPPQSNDKSRMSKSLNGWVNAGDRWITELFLQTSSIRVRRC